MDSGIGQGLLDGGWREVFMQGSIKRGSREVDESGH